MHRPICKWFGSITDAWDLKKRNPQFKNDKTFVSRAIGKCSDRFVPYAFKRVGDELRNTREFGIYQVSIFKQASENLKNDRTSVLGAVEQKKNPTASQYASKYPLSDREFVLQAINHGDRSALHEVFQYILENLRNNREVSVQAVSGETCTWYISE